MTGTMQKAKKHAANPFAERVTPEEFGRLVHDFYGTKTLVFDRAMAEAVLAYNTGNRRVNRRKIQVLAAEMESGEFENTGEPLILSAEGVLNDGQHRLLAVIESGATVDMDIRFGIPRRAFTKTDTGAGRNANDVLTIKGIAHGGAIASAIRLLILYQRGLPDSIREFVSNDLIARGADRWADIAGIATQLHELSFPKAVRSTPLYATAYLASLSPRKARLPLWLEGLATGADISRSSPVYQLRERLMREAEAPKGTRELLLERFALMIFSWNLFASDQTVPLKEFRWRQVGRVVDPFPRVEAGRLLGLEK